MAKVYVVMQHCCDNYDDSAPYSVEVVGVSENRVIAEILIETLSRNLIKKTYEEGGIATDVTTVGGDVSVITEHYNDHVTYISKYWWTIEEHDLMEL